MKIIIIGPAYPYRGGIADTNESLCRSLLAKNHEASIVTFRLQYPNFLFPGKTQYSSDPKPKNLSILPLVNSMNPFNWVQTARKINQLKPDLVVVRYWLPFMGPCLGSIARLLKKDIKLIAMCDNILPHESRLGDRLFTTYFTKAFDGFITLSKTVLEELDQFTTKPSVYFPHPINDNLGQKVPRSEARDYLKIDQNGRYLLFFGLIRKYKGLDLLLKALGEKFLKDLDVKLLIVGEFYDKPEEYHELIEQYNLQDRVDIRNEYIPTSEIKYYFSAADLSTQTYHSASQSGITQMAFNFDCPVLVTDVGGLSEFVPHQKIGYVSSKEPSAIAGFIADFYQNDRRSTFSEQVKEEKKKYSWKAFSDSLLELYQQV